MAPILWHDCQRCEWALLRAFVQAFRLSVPVNIGHTGLLTRQFAPVLVPVLALVRVPVLALVPVPVLALVLVPVLALVLITTSCHFSYLRLST